MTRKINILALCAVALLTLPLPAVAQECAKSPQTNICLSLVPNSNVLPSLPEALQVHNNEEVLIHITNVSPLEVCKLSGTTFASEPPASALQGAVTAAMGMAPFGLGANLSAAIAKNGPAVKSYVEHPLIDKQNDPVERAIQLQSGVIERGGLLFDLQIAKQQDGAAIAAMYSVFSSTDFRKPGTFQSPFTDLSARLVENLNFIPPGELADSAITAYRRVNSKNSGGLLKDLNPQPDPNAKTKDGKPLFIIDLQSDLDEAKSLIASAHTLYDKDPTIQKDPKRLAELNALYVHSDDLQSIATQLLALINANDTALRTQQTSLITLKLSIDQLQNNAFDNGRAKENIDLPIPRAKDGKVSGTITCLNRLDNTKVTLDPMPYSVDYQKVPMLSFSTGLLISPINKKIFGTTTVKDTSTPAPVTTPPTPVTTLNEVALTDSSPFQAVPFSFLNLRLLPGWSYRGLKPKSVLWRYCSPLYEKCPKFAGFLSRRVFTTGVTGGFGVNPNGGSTSPEYFAGIFGSVDRVMLHLGLDEGRIQTLTGQFALGDVVPSATTIPTDHHFVGKLGGAISVRLYP